MEPIVLLKNVKVKRRMLEFAMHLNVFFYINVFVCVIQLSFSQPSYYIYDIAVI